MTSTYVHDILQGSDPDAKELYANFKPIRYRYVMAYLHDQVEKDESGVDVLHKAGEMMAILPMTTVTYGVGMYSGTEMSGNVALPEMSLNLMPHPPLNDFERRAHPDQTGVPVGSMFECGNRAIYVMRNEEVVWGGILWTRSYASGTPQLAITALSWDGYIYYRLLRLSIVFPAEVNMYMIWYAVMMAAFSDFDWLTPDGRDGRDAYDSYTKTTEESVAADDVTGSGTGSTSGGTGGGSGGGSGGGDGKGKGHGNGGKGKQKGPHWVPGATAAQKDKKKKKEREDKGQKPFNPPGKDGHDAYDNEGRTLTQSCPAGQRWSKKKKMCVGTAAATDDPADDSEEIVQVKWTGIDGDYSNMPPINFREQWPNNCPRIELPPADLKLFYDPENNTGMVGEMTAQKEWRGYDMGIIGASLQEWADTETVASYGGGKRFEYRVVCWYDTAQQLFRQRYVVGRMSYPAGQDPNNPVPNGILKPSLGENTKAMGYAADNQLIFDFPGNIASWSLGESMEEAATRVIVTDDGDQALKLVGYGWDHELLNVPPANLYSPSVEGAPADVAPGSQGWLLYDRTTSFGTSSPSELKSRAERLVQLFKVPTAAQLQDLTGAPKVQKMQRSSRRSTTLTVSLYSEPSRPLPEFRLGDWAAFAIEDPFYGGKMYLVRRIVGYSVTVVPEQESDYSHEQIELELTDDTQIAIS